MKNWREDDGLIQRNLYKKVFAIKPVICCDGAKVWLRHYYKKYTVWEYHVGEDGFDEGHVDFVEDLSEEEFMVRKLAEKL